VSEPLENKKQRSLNNSLTGFDGLEVDSISDEIATYSKEVLDTIIKDGLPPSPNNFSLYFDRLLETKPKKLRHQIIEMIELEENNDDENIVTLENGLKKGFMSVKSILGVTANLYKNMLLMGKILEKRKKELENNPELAEALKMINMLGGDVSKLSTIVKKQSTQIKNLYDETATIVKNVENETIFDNTFGVYNKRYLIKKLEHEISLVKEYKHQSSLIMVELHNEIKNSVKHEKALLLMTKTISRLLLKTSRRSDIVSYYGNGRFAMLLKHTDIESAKRASERLCELVGNSNFFLGEVDIQLRIAIGITNVDPKRTVEEILVSSMDGVEKSYKDKENDFAVSLAIESKTKK